MFPILPFGKLPTVKTKLLLFLLAPLLILSVRADEIRGVVSVVLPGSITVATHKLGEMAYAVDSKTRVMTEAGQPGTLADLTQGVVVEIRTGTNANQAEEIRIVPPRESEKQ
jgi:hypothetical protein